MATSIYENVNFTTKTDEEYFIGFYEEILKTYLPPRYKIMITKINLMQKAH